MREDDWKRDDEELERVIEERDRIEKQDVQDEIPKRRVPRFLEEGKLAKEKKKFVKVRFLGEWDLIEGVEIKKGEEKEVVDWLASVWIEKGYVEKVEG